MRPVLDAADIERTIVLDRAKRYTVIAAARDTPSLEFKSQWLR